MYEFEQIDRLSDVKITDNNSEFSNNLFSPNSDGEDSGKKVASQANGKSIEEIAFSAGLIPLEIIRDSCTAEAENMLRKLGRVAEGDAPWVPIGSMGPLIIIAHCDPNSEDTWGIPDLLCVKVVISAEKYLSLIHISEPTRPY